MTNYNDGKWHGWNGGECPVHTHSLIDVTFGDGWCRGRYPDEFCWDHKEKPIIAFRVVKPYCEPREFWVNVYPDDFVAAHVTKEEAEDNKASTRLACIRVREVLEE